MLAGLPLTRVAEGEGGEGALVFQGRLVRVSRLDGTGQPP